MSDHRLPADGQLIDRDRLNIEYWELGYCLGRRWKDNQKRHDIGGIITSIRRYGFKDSLHYDDTLEAFEEDNMIVLSFERWNSAAGKWFVRTRIYHKGYIWTPFVRIRRRWSNMRDRFLKVNADHEKLRDLAIWMTGCGYDFAQHDYFVENRHLLAGNRPDPPE